jgi:hypothetical protein
MESPLQFSEGHSTDRAQLVADLFCVVAAAATLGGYASILFHSDWTQMSWRDWIVVAILGGILSRGVRDQSPGQARGLDANCGRHGERHRVGDWTAVHVWLARDDHRPACLRVANASTQRCSSPVRPLMLHLHHV